MKSARNGLPAEPANNVTCGIDWACDDHAVSVVDASGRGSSSPAWLESFGYARPEEERIEIGIGYTTRVYRRHKTDLGGKLGTRAFGACVAATAEALSKQHG